MGVQISPTAPVTRVKLYNYFISLAYTNSMNTYSLKDTSLFLDVSSKDRKYILTIKDLPSDNKPRERLRKLGPSALSTQELLAIVLGTGTKKEGVLEMSHRVLKEYGERTLIHHKNPEHMAKTLGIPLVKALQIVACGELGRRFFEKHDYGSWTIRSAKDVYEYVRDMHTLPKEHLRGIYVNTHHKIVHDEVLTIGTINSNVIHPREVFKPAIEYGAVAVILAHNHPSGITAPSEADIEITKQLVEAGKILGINILDHIIVTKKGFESININYN
jgi:DNA repair protein RadC